MGLVRSIGTDTFVLKTDVDADSIGSDELEERYRRNTGRMKNISDISFLTSYGMKEINLRFFKSRNDDGNEYNLVRNRTDKTKARILNAKGTRLYRVFREFPFDEPLVSQCAHWMRAFAGFHFFPDANHRTGMISLENIMKANGIDKSDKLPGPHRDRAVLRSKLLRILHVDRITLGDLWVKDEYYTHWSNYFETLFHPQANQFSTECKIESLQKALNAARTEERNWS